MSSEGKVRRNRKASLSDSEIMTILIMFEFGSFHNFKHYYLFFIRQHLKSYFPNAVSYNRFVELQSRVFFQMMFFLNLSAFGRYTGISFVGSTMVPVCHNLRPNANKVFRRLPLMERGRWVGVTVSCCIWSAMTGVRLSPSALQEPMWTTGIQRSGLFWQRPSTGSSLQTWDTSRRSCLRGSLRTGYTWSRESGQT